MHICTTTARIQKNIERVKVATQALTKSVTTWVSDHKEVLITGALIVGTAALVVATGGIGAACVPGLIMATAGGAVLGAGGDIVGQMISNQSMDLSKIDWGSVALSGLAGGATGLLSATGAGPVAMGIMMGIMGGVSSGSSEIYHQMQSGEEINWGQVAIRTLGGAVSGAVLGNVGSQTASGAKEIAKNAGKVFLANGGVSFAENLTYNLIGGEDLGTAAKQASFSALISGGTSAGFYALGQAAKNMCFVEGTMVLTAAGLVAIESIAVGDMVIATDPETGETAEKQVKNTFVNETEELAHVFVDGEEIVCTPGHKFYAPERGWTSAIKLRAGDKLQLVNGEYVTVEKVQHELLEEPVKIYNFEVEDFHTYYVGTDCSVLVHNRMNCGGESNASKNGKKIHKERADKRRNGTYDMSDRNFVHFVDGTTSNQTTSNPFSKDSQYETINQKLLDNDGNPIKVHRTVDKKSGKKSIIKQSVAPDAILEGYIIDDKPVGRPIAKDYQELGRNVEAYKARFGVDAKGVVIDRYDPKTGANGNIEIYPISMFSRNNRGGKK